MPQYWGDKIGFQGPPRGTALGSTGLPDEPYNLHGLGLSLIEQATPSLSHSGHSLHQLPGQAQAELLSASRMLSDNDQQSIK
jgi:hypothetical protein